MAEVDDELAAIVRARVGTTLCGGKYRIDRVLGIGGMAAVYAGTHRNGRPVAIKLLHPVFSRNADIRKRFLREGQASNAVQHRGVVAVIDDDVAEDGAAFVVMERLEGKTLEQLWEEVGRRFPLRAVLAIGRELCEILAVAHRSGIIHRDLKPENLFLTNEAELKVLDFGLAQLRIAAQPTETLTGTVLGTPAFMPPEQAAGQTRNIDARTDLWAVGATMFTLLSGELVHRGETAHQFLLLAATEPARSLAAVMPNAHPALIALVDRALAREKERRWQSAESMREAIVSLSELAIGEPETPLMTPRALQEAAAPRRVKPVVKRPTSYDDSTIPAGKRPPSGDLTDETLDDNSAAAPDFAGVSEDTEPSARQRAANPLPRLDGVSSSASDEDSEDHATALHPMPEKRVSWSDLRHAMEQAKTDPPPNEPPKPPAKSAVARTQTLPPFAPPSGHHPVPPSSVPNMPASFAIPPDRASVPAPLPMPPPMTGPLPIRAPRSASIRYVPVVVVAILLGLSALAYFAARG